MIFPKGSIHTKLKDGTYKARDSENNTSITYKNDFIIKNGIVITELITEGRFVWTQDFLNNELKLGAQVFLSQKFGFNVLRHNQAEKTKTPSTLVDKKVDVGTNEDASSEIAKLFNMEVGVMFEYAKPISLIKYLTNFLVNENEFILDFFAGSGTTGDAVMQLNADPSMNSGDVGNRKFILVQLPEPIDPKSDKTAYDFVQQLKTKNQELNNPEPPTIFDITKERLIRASKKINAELDEKTKRLRT